jgi:hypothetical protein
VIFFLVVAVVVVVEKEPSQNTNGWMCIEENRGEITLFSLFRFALVRTQSRQRGNESTPLLDSIALLHTLTPAVCVCVCVSRLSLSVNSNHFLADDRMMRFRQTIDRKSLSVFSREFLEIYFIF